MLRLALCALVLSLVVATGSSRADETVRFETNVGSFDVLLNPTDNPDLQPLVDNFLQYVEAGRWVGAVINRAAQDFVVQMAGFRTDDLDIADVPSTGLPQVESFPEVVVDADLNGEVDFDTTGLSNTRGEVALALRSGDANSGSSSFFVNLGDNSFLDAQDFIPFARIPDMTLMDQLANSDVVDISANVNQFGSLAYTDVPVAPGDQFVVIEAVSIVPEPASATLLVLGAAAAACGGRSPRGKRR